MAFPLTFTLGSAQITAHGLFEALAYAVGFGVYRRVRRSQEDFLGEGARWTLVVAAVLGAALGSKVLHHVGRPTDLLAHWRDPVHLAGGKTIVGGLLGGLAAVEAVKRSRGITRATGDLYVLPLAIGIAIGRVGCFTSGISDGTHGVETSVPWAVDFGDGVLRHPVRLYEIAFLGMLAAVTIARSRREHEEGALFRGFMVGYLAFRASVDSLKPGERLVGLTVIQWACLAGLLYYAIAAGRRRPARAGAAR